MKRLLCLLLLLLVIPMNCHAWVRANGYKQDEVVNFSNTVTDFFQKNYNLELKKDVIVLIAKNKKEYRRWIVDFGLSFGLVDSTYGFTVASEKYRYILVNYEKCGKRFWFTIAHELTHAYQEEYYIEPYASDYAMTEGKADLMAAQITGYPIKTQDNGISCEDMKDFDGHAKAIVKYGVDKVDEQVRHYASQTEGFFPYKKDK